MCAQCHGSGSLITNGDIVTTYSGTPHDIALTSPASGTQIKCIRCHQPHGSPYKKLLNTSILDQAGVPHIITGNNNSVCFACHTDSSGTYPGQAVYEQSVHGKVYASSTFISDKQQNDFAQGTLTDVTADAGGVILAGNMGLTFDGYDDRINLSTAYTGIQNSFTYEFWVKPQYTITLGTEATSGSVGGSGQRYAIGAQNSATTTTAGVGVSVGTNGIAVYEQGSGYFPPLLVYGTTITDWVHVAVVYNNKQPSLYINGVLKRTGLTSTKIPFPSNTFGYPNGYFSGSLDDIRIWNYARTQAEIQADMNREVAGNEGGLAGYWKLNEGTGTTIASSSAANNGTLAGGVAWSRSASRYSMSGNRVSPDYDMVASTTYSSQISWNSSIPAGTSLDVDTNLFLGGTWQGWQSATNGGSIPGISAGTNLTGGKIKYRVRLTSTSTSSSPRLQDANVVISHVPVAARTVYPGTSYQPTQCANCHEPHGKTGVSAYRRADGNQLCFNCHDDPGVIRPSSYSYQGSAAYEQSSHASAKVIGGAVLNAGGSNFSAWEGTNQPSPGSPGTPMDGTVQAAMAAQDSDWAVTSLAGAGAADYQMYRFKVDTPVAQIHSLTARWTGAGENSATAPYRSPITISGSTAGPLTDYQVQVTVNT
ncbi:MAG TPA: LamG-like jellyroll fold domain-containing protein, partial [Bacillota bacterium]|nr:LamG-like jellyroll fold domain-containing protein [Bacillota bacterium]